MSRDGGPAGARSAEPSAHHFGHNAFVLDRYPGPGWITPTVVVVVWAVMAPLLVGGAVLVRHGRRATGRALLVVWGLLSLASVGHYAYGDARSMGAVVHATILLDVGAAAVLVVYALTALGRR